MQISSMETIQYNTNLQKDDGQLVEIPQEVEFNWTSCNINNQRSTCQIWTNQSLQYQFSLEYELFEQLIIKILTLKGIIWVMDMIVVQYSSNLTWDGLILEELLLYSNLSNCCSVYKPLCF